MEEVPADLVVATRVRGGFEEGEISGKFGENSEMSLGVSDRGIGVLLIGLLAGPFFLSGNPVYDAVVDFLNLVPLEGTAERSGGLAPGGE